MFVLVLVADNGGERNDVSMRPPDEEGESRWQGGWVPRHGFAPKLRRCKPVGISVGSAAFCNEPFPSILTGHGVVPADLPPLQADLESMSVSGPALVATALVLDSRAPAGLSGLVM